MGCAVGCLFYQFTPVTVALPREIVGALRSLLILACLSHYLTFSLTWSPAVFQLRVVSDNPDSPLGHLNGTILFLHCELVHWQSLVSSTFPLLCQGSWNRLLGGFSPLHVLIVFKLWLILMQRTKKKTFLFFKEDFSDFDIANLKNTSMWHDTDMIILNINSLSLGISLLVAVQWKELTVKVCQVNIIWAAREERKCFWKLIFYCLCVSAYLICKHMWGKDCKYWE